MLDIFVSVMEILSLALITASFLILAYLSATARTVRSLRFQMFIFSLILTLSEVPRIVGTLGLIDIGVIETPGLGIHTVSMVALAGILVYQVRRHRSGR